MIRNASKEKPEDKLTFKDYRFTKPLVAKIKKNNWKSVLFIDNTDKPANNFLRLACRNLKKLPE